MPSPNASAFPMGYYDKRIPVMGIAGTGAEAMMQKSDGHVFYVNPLHADANDGHEGLDADHPLATIQGLLDRTTANITYPRLENNDIIYVCSSITESVIVPGTAPTGCAIIGIGNSYGRPLWLPGASAGTNLTIRALDWRVSNFHFGFTGNSIAIRLDWVPASSYNGSQCTIDNCWFFGEWAGFRGIALYGAPYNVRIINNEFGEIRSAGGGGTAYAIATVDSSEANAYECQVIGNVFWENENHIGSIGNDRSFNMSLFQGNVFHNGVLIASNVKLDLRGGTRGENIVTGNVFYGDYSNVGGYWGNAANPDFWVGNITNDLLEAEVADNGFTIAPPA